MKIMISILAALALAGCALRRDQQSQWDRQTAFYNIAAETIIRLREPCVVVGPEDPGCILNDAKYSKVRIFQTTADGYLKAAELQLKAGDQSKASFYLKSSAGALLALGDQIGLPAE